MSLPRLYLVWLAFVVMWTGSTVTIAVERSAPVEVFGTVPGATVSQPTVTVLPQLVETVEPTATEAAAEAAALGALPQTSIPHDLLDALRDLLATSAGKVVVTLSLVGVTLTLQQALTGIRFLSY